MSISNRVRSLLEEIASLDAAHRERQRAIARSFGLGRAGLSLVLAVGGEGGTIPQLARRLSLTRQSVQRVADALVESKLASYQPNPDHRRSPRLVLTAEGEAKRKALERAVIELAPDVSDDLDEEDLETTLHVLRALRALL